MEELIRESRILSCGHNPSPHHQWTTGTAHTILGAEICWDCAHKMTLEDMRLHSKATLYLSSDGEKITSWSGRIVSEKVNIIRKSWNNFGGTMRYYVRFEFEGEIWSGAGMGEGMYLNARKTKLKDLKA